MSKRQRLNVERVKPACGSAAAGLLGFAMLGFASLAEAAEWRINETTKFSAYASIELIYLHERKRTSPTDVDGLFRLRDRDSTIGLAGAHRFGDSLVAFFRGELEYQGGALVGEGDTSDTDIGDIDTAYVGVKGPWGQLQLGIWDGVYENLMADATDLFEYEGATKFEQYRTGEIGDSVAYVSPSFNGFSFAVQGFFDGRSNTGQGRAFQLVVGYGSHDYAVHVGYDDNGFDPNAGGTLGISGSVDLNPVSLAVKYEHVGGDRGDPDNPNDTRRVISAYTLSGAYDYGHGSVIAVVQQVEPAGGVGRTEFGLHVDYSITEDFYVYAEHMGYDKNRDLDNYTGVGLVYEF